MGPGIITGFAGNDAGGVTTYTAVGAHYGFAMLWLLLLSTAGLLVIQEMCARMGAVTGKGLSDLIREQFGIRWALFATVALFVANAGTAFSEFIGIAAALELLNISRNIAVPIAAIALWLIVARGSYKAVERIFLVMTVAFFAYPLSALLARPDWLAVGKGALVPTLSGHAGYLKVLIALIGTTITPYMQIY